MGIGDGTRSANGARSAASGPLREALHKLQAADALISLAIDEELAGGKDRTTLERLRSARRALGCAIADGQEQLSSDDC